MTITMMMIIMMISPLSYTRTYAAENEQQYETNLQETVKVEEANLGKKQDESQTEDAGNVKEDVIVMEDDCGTHEGLVVETIKESGEAIEKLEERIEGRYLAQDILDQNGDIIVPNGTYVTDKVAKIIVDTGIEKVKIRSALTCESVTVTVCAD